MIQFIPFAVGAAIGAGLVMVVGNKKTKEKLIQGKEYVSSKIDDGVSTVKAFGDCVSEKRSSKKESAETTEQAPTPTEG